METRERDRAVPAEYIVWGSAIGGYAVRCALDADDAASKVGGKIGEHCSAIKTDSDLYNHEHVAEGFCVERFVSSGDARRGLMRLLIVGAFAAGHEVND